MQSIVSTNKSITNRSIESKGSKGSKGSNGSKSKSGMKDGVLSPTLLGRNKEFTNIKHSITSKLLLKLEKARKIITEDNDIYINKEHELMCQYYKQMLELKSKVSLQNKQIELNYKKNVINHTENNTFQQKYADRQKLDFVNTTYTYEMKYNDYNKKFVNKMQQFLNIDNIQSFLDQQSAFLQSLSLREIYCLKYYTYHGDVYVNAFLDGTFTPQIIQSIGDSIIDEGSDLCYFFYQFLDYFTMNKFYNDIEVNIQDNEQFIEFLSENYLSFNEKIYNFVFSQYINDMKGIFDKAPLTNHRIILYRGIKDNYILQKSNRGFYKTNHISSTSLFAEVAFSYTRSKNRMMLKVIVDKGLPIIFLEGITISPKEFEVILPINATLYIDHAKKPINFFRKKDTVICPNVDNDDVVNMTTIMYTHYS